MSLITGFVVLSSILAVRQAAPALPSPGKGKLDHLSNFGSVELGQHDVDIWLPEGYDPAKKYSVLYMHDGQMLFDARTTWNKQEWEVDETFSRLMEIGAIRDTIVVGPYNRGEFRHTDYFPQKALDYLPAETKAAVIAKDLKGKPLSDNYLKFLVTELKPYVDSHYSPKRGRGDTFVAGSSMGGLISMYAICEYPNVFGGAACISTHWPGSISVPGCEVGFQKYLKDHAPSLKDHKIYFDHGDKTLDAMYPPHQARVDHLMKEAGWTSKNYASLFFPGDDHSEKSWSRRLYLPVLFLLGK